MPRFALIGAAGYIAPRHIQAIHDTGNTLVAACDPHDSVGILDKYGYGVEYFPEIERFERHLDKLRRKGEGVDYVSIVSPNYLHDAHVRLALRSGANAICEKPLVINPWNLDALAELENEKRVYTVLQLRSHPELIEFRNRVSSGHKVSLTYHTPRGRWYRNSWKGDEAKSGGIATNIGIHLFDMLLWLFGEVHDIRLDHRNDESIRGHFVMERAEVDWTLSIASRERFRGMICDGERIGFDNGFTDLHTTVYEKILSGHGDGIDDARPSIELVSRIRSL